MSRESLKLGFVVAGKYVVERELGRGGMGVVYVVSHATTGKRMAMKCLLPHLVHDAELVGRFMREAKVLGRLTHRHVVDVYDVGRDGDVLYIVMELLEGKVLSELLSDATTSLEDALLIVLRAMEGVAAAHEHGVIHRDLKPDNIFVCVGASGRLDDPRVLDFGISRLEESSGPQLTRTGVAIGTPYYMAYEQLSGQRDLDPRVDVYAMGVILYEAIAGAPPFVGSSLSAVAVRMLTTEPDHLATLRPDLPAGLADVVMKAISRIRDGRHADMRALIDDLRPFVARSGPLGLPGRAGVPLRTPGNLRLSAAHSAPSESAIRARNAANVSAEPVSPTSTMAGPRHSRGAMMGASCAALLALGSGAWYLTREAPAAPRAADLAPQVPRVPQPAEPPSPTTSTATVESAARGVGEQATGAAHAAPQPALASDAGAAVGKASPQARLPAAARPKWTRAAGATSGARPPARPWMRAAPDAGAAAAATPTPAPHAKPPASPTTAVKEDATAAPSVAPEPAQHGTSPTPAERRRSEGRAGRLGSSEF